VHCAGKKPGKELPVTNGPEQNGGPGAGMIRVSACFPAGGFN